MNAVERKREIYKVTLIGAIGNVILPVIKGVIGVLTGSGALIADAVHSATDLVTDAVVLFCTRIAAKPSDDDHAYGHGKYEVIASAIISLSLLVVGAFILAKSVEILYRFFAEGVMIAQPGAIAIWAALISILAKEVLFRYTIRVARKVNSEAVKANAWHHRSDALSSVGVFIGLSAAYFLGEGARFMEPLSAIFVAVLIIKVGMEIGMNALRELSEKALPVETEREILEIVERVEGVFNPHNLRTRKVGQRIAIEVDIMVDGQMTVERSHCLTELVEATLRKRYGEETHIVIHVEPNKPSVDNKYEREYESRRNV
ncbi:MAG: cation diffusion facilitator family transporter [Porphyromonas sp.]|nr:cation diffusion facilitator family transporter [Porphyromonas sp.]